MEKLGLKACIDALRGNRSLAECMNMIVNVEYDELFANSNEWYTEAIAYMKKTNSPEAVSQLLLTLCHYCQFTFMSERVDIESDLKKRISELGDRVAEGQSLIKTQPQFAAVAYASEAAFYLYVASLNIRLSKKSRQSTSRNSFDSTCALLALCYDLSTRASSHFIELSTPSTNESRILAQAERINALNCVIAGTMLVERLRSMQQQQTTRPSIGPDTWTARFPNIFAESQACLKRTLDVKDSSPIVTSLCYSSPQAILTSSIPSLPDLLALFERVLTSSVDLQALVWCTVHLRRLFPISTTSSHQYTDALVIESLAKGEALRRCSHLPSSLVGDFSSPSADALCQVDVVAFILMAAARVELSLPPIDESIGDSIQPPFTTSSLGSSELGGESLWLTTSQVQWWRAVVIASSQDHRQTPQQPQQPSQDPFAKFRLIQDGLFLLRLSGMDAKLSYLAIRVAEAFQAFVLEHYFNTVHHETDAKCTTSLQGDVRRFHVYCCKYFDILLQSVHASRSGPHHSQRISLGGTGVPPSRQQRFFEPFPLLSTSGMGASLETISSELRNRVTILANFYLGFDAFLNGSFETSVKMLKTCSSELILASFFEGRAFEAMAEEAHEKSLRTASSSTSSSWVVRQLYESALTAYEKAVGYTQTGTQQVQRGLVVEAAAKSAARIKKNLLGTGARREETLPSSASTSVQRVVATVPVNGGCETGAESPTPPASAASQQQQQAIALIQQQQEQSLSILNNTVGQLVPAIRDLSTAARDLADVARQLRDLERQLRESVVRMECGIQQQQQRPPSSAATATPPVSAPAPPGGITAEQLLPLLMDLIRERNMPPPAPVVGPHPYMSPNITGQPSLLMRHLAGQIDATMVMNQPMSGFGMPPPPKPEGGFEMPPPMQQPFPPTCAMAGPSQVQQFSQQQPPHLSSSAFSPLVPPPVSIVPQMPQQQTAFPQQQRVPPVPALAVTGASLVPPAAQIQGAVHVKDKKPAHEPTKPQAAPPAKPGHGQEPRPLADLFKQSPGSWTCQTCLIQNKETNERCAACETPKPAGAITSAAPPTMTTMTKQLPQISFPPPASSTGPAKPPAPAQPSPSLPIFGASLFPKPTGETSGIQFGVGPTSSPLFGAKPLGPPITTTTTPTVTTKVATEAPKPLFGFQVPPVKETDVKPKEPEAKAEGGQEEAGESPEEFVPTAEYHPVAQLPQNYEVVTGEENEERLFSDKAKLYRWADTTNEWKERGVGEMKVLRNKETGRSRILMRREQIFKPCANHYITADFSLRQFPAVGDRGFCWLAADYAEVESGEQPQLMQLAVRFRNAEAAQEFKKVIESCRSSAPTMSTKSPVRPAKPATTAPAPAVKAPEKSPQTQPPQPKPAETKMTTETKALSTTITSPPVPAVSQPSGLPVPIFGSSFAKKPEGAPAAIGGNGLFSFAALAAANVKPGETEAKPAPQKEGAAPFVGQPEPLFKSLMTKTAPTMAVEQAATGGEGGGEEVVEGGEQPEAFVPTADYKPVVQLPSDYKHVSGEEGFERVFSERCKLYRWDSSANEWKERGIGDIRLMKATDGSSKYRIVMRREHIHTVCANHYLTISPSMKLGRLPSAADRAVTWFSPSDYSDGEAKLETLCARFKSPALADQFSACFKAAIDDLTQKYGTGEGKPSPTKPPTTTTPTTTNENIKPVEVASGSAAPKPQTTPSFSFAAPGQSPAIATTTATLTGTPSLAAGGLFGSSMLSNAGKAGGGDAGPTPGTTFSGFRFGQLGATPTQVTPQPKTGLFGSSSAGVFGGAGGNATPGSFSFSGVFPTGPSPGTDTGALEGGGQSASKGSVGENDECVLVSATHANPDEVARARQYLLPDDFYLYRLRKPCSGCPGCENNDENNENTAAAAGNKNGDQGKLNANPQTSTTIKQNNNSASSTPADSQIPPE